MKKLSHAEGVYGFAPRSYRSPAQRSGERSFQVVDGESDLWITVSGDCAPAGGSPEEIALAAVRAARAVVKNRILLQPEFAASLVPLPIPENAPDIIRRMCSAAEAMGVGPMATIAGAVAAAAVDALLPYTSECIVENGGDTVLHSTVERIVAILPDPERSAMLGLRICEGEFPAAICASSSTIGHSLSFGKGELAVVRAQDPFIADAAATAFCNMLQSPDDAGRVASHAAGLASQGIEGVFLQCRGAIAVWGKMELAAL